MTRHTNDVAAATPWYIEQAGFSPRHKHDCLSGAVSWALLCTRVSPAVGLSWRSLSAGLIREADVAAAQPGRPVKALLGPSVPVQPVFFRSRVGLEEAEGNVGQNSLLTSISCCWGAQGSWEGVKGGSPC